MRILSGKGDMNGKIFFFPDDSEDWINMKNFFSGRENVIIQEGKYIENSHIEYAEQGIDINVNT